LLLTLEINTKNCEFCHYRHCLFNSSTAIGGYDRQLFNKLCARLVSPLIFVRYQRLMARKIAELFGLNPGVQPFYAACCFNELSRGPILCLLNASFKTAVSHATTQFFEPKSMIMVSAGAIQGKYLPNAAYGSI
jgi:hypothetical protein